MTQAATDIKAITDLYTYTPADEVTADANEIRLKYGMYALKAIYPLEPKLSNRCNEKHPRYDFYCTRIKGHTMHHEAQVAVGIAGIPRWFSAEAHEKQAKQTLHNYHISGYSNAVRAQWPEKWYGHWGGLIPQCNKAGSGYNCGLIKDHDGPHQAMFDGNTACGEPWGNGWVSVPKPTTATPISGTIGDKLAATEAAWQGQDTVPQAAAEPAEKPVWKAYISHAHMPLFPHANDLGKPYCSTHPSTEGEGADYGCTREKGHPGPHEAHWGSKSACGPPWMDGEYQ